MRRLTKLPLRPAQPLHCRFGGWTGGGGPAQPKAHVAPAPRSGQGRLRASDGREDEDGSHGEDAPGTSIT